MNSTIFLGEWKDEDGFEHRFWVEAASKDEAEALFRSLADGNRVQVYGPNHVQTAA